MARVHLKAAGGLSSTGSTGWVPAGALGLGGAGKQWGHQMGGYVQLVEGGVGGEGEPQSHSSCTFCARWYRE